MILSRVITRTLSTTKTGKSAVLLSEYQPRMFWKAFDPFLFCAYHKDNYPKSVSSGSNMEDMAIDPKLVSDRNLGNDFSGLNGFSMYLGKTIPGLYESSAQRVS